MNDTPITNNDNTAAPQTNEAVTTPSNNEAASTAQDSVTPEQVASFFGTDKETLNSFKTFAQANGSFDKVFDKIKETVTRRTADMKAVDTKAPEAPQQPEAPKTETNPSPAPQAAPRVPEGYVTPQEVAVKQYFEGLASAEAYKGIADEIRSGEVFKEMAKLGINPTNEQGYINDAKVRAYLDIKAQTVVAKQEANVLAAKSAAPTVEYIGGENANITTFKEATDILAQSRELKAKGLAGNPNEKAAIEFIAKATGGNLDALKK